MVRRVACRCAATSSQAHIQAPVPSPSHIPDLHDGSASLLVLLNVDVDGEMRVDVAHLVLVSLGNTGDQVLDQGLDGPQSGDVLADTMVQLDADDLGALGDEGDSEVLEVLDELAAGSGNGDDAGLDDDGDCISRFPSAPCSRTKDSPKFPVRSSSNF
jgi:hypothetical protein